MPVRPQTSPGKGTAAISGKAASGDAKLTGTDNNGAVMSDTPNTDAPKIEAKENGVASRPANTQDATTVQAAQSSAPRQSADTSTPSVTATAVQPQVQTASVASLNVNLQVAPQHSDVKTTPTIDLLGVTIAAKSADGIKHFDIRLDPPELGRVQVHLSLDDSGKAQASLVVDKPQTLELLQRDAGNLTRSLNDAGVSLSNNGLNFSLRGQDRQSDGGVVKGRGRVLSVKALVGTDAISKSGSIASLAPDSVRLDIRV
jgi:flagellar hook-length control protein FliK